MFYTKGRLSMKLSNRIRELREEKNLTQIELAKKFNITSASISQYELGKRFPDQETLEKLADYFNVSIDYLIGRSTDRTSFIGNNPKNFISSNMELLKGDMTWEEMSNDISVKTNRPSMAEYYNPKYLKNLADGKENPPYPRISMLAMYAGVHPDFFYRENTKKDLKIARQQYKSDMEKKHLSKEKQDFVNDPDNDIYIEFAMKMKEQGINPKDVKGFDLKFEI